MGLPDQFGSGAKESVMDIGSVNSSQVAASTLNPQVQGRVRQADQDQQAQQAQQTLQAQSRSAAKETESTASAQAETERNRPTVNTSGQVVGTRINTTA